MDHHTILETYGGLPPSAFVLEPSFSNLTLPPSEPCPNAGTTAEDESPKDSNQADAFEQSKSSKKTSKKNKKTGFSRSSKSILNSSFLDNPYPAKKTIIDLASEAKLTIKQVKTFFANKRSRTAPQESHIDTLSISDPICLNRSSLERLNAECASTEAPVALNRFLDTSPQDDAVELSVIEQSARQTPPPHDGHSSISSTYEMHRAKSVFSAAASSLMSGTSDLSSLSAVTSGSFASYASLRSSNGRVSKRGRRRHAVKIRKARTPSPEKVYFCTFCGEHFTTRHAWNRHEESIHIPRRWWICRPEELITGPLGFAHGPYDLTENPSVGPLATYNHHDCMKRPGAERTFYRRDNLEQHLKNFHYVSHNDVVKHLATEWKVEAPPLPLDHPYLRCQFCGKAEPTWEMRVEHVAAHFKDDDEAKLWQIFR